MKTSSVVRLHALVSILPEDWENFEIQLAETKRIVQAEGDDVLTHACYLQSGTYECLIVEEYANEKAFLNHLSIIGTVAKQYPVKMTFQRVELAGPYSAQTVMLLKENIRGCDVKHFNIDLQTK